MGSTYDIGDVVRITGTFTDTGGTYGDPTTVNFLYDTPDTAGSPTTATRPGTSTGNVNGIVRASSGVFYYDILTTGEGLYEARFTSTGTLQTSGEAWFSVRPQRVTT